VISVIPFGLILHSGNITRRYIYITRQVIEVSERTKMPASK